MLRIIRKAVKTLLVICITISILLTGVPAEPIIIEIQERIADRNVVDSLYLALKDPNVIDKGLLEVLQPHVKKAHAATFSIQTGYYVGNNSDNRSISGLGFSPDLVLLKDNTAVGAEGMIFKTRDMAGELTLTLSETDANLSTNHIQSFNASGFTVGTDTDVNSSNVMYYYAAFSGSDCSSSGTFCTGTYSGNGSSQAISSVGFQPDLVVVKRAGASVGIWRSASMGGANSNYFHNANQLASGGITSLDASGFSIGNNASVNTNGNSYYYFAFKEVSGFMDVGTYSGNGTDNRTIDSGVDAGLTFQPDFVWIKNESAATAQTAVASFREHYGDRSVLFTDTASAANHIQSLLSGGGFQIGTTASVNSSAIAYHYVGFGGAPSRSAGSGSFDMDTGSYTGTGATYSVTGLSFSPDLVIIKDNSTNQSVFRTKLMIGDRTHYLANNVSVFTGGITALNSDGFTLGTSTVSNTLGNTYYWTAFGNAMKPDVSGGSSDFLIGQYIGTGNDNQNVRGLPIEPDLVALKRVGATQGAWRTSNQVGDVSLLFHASAQIANIIQSLNGDGFQKGGAANANTSGSIYDYFAFVSGGNFTTGTYTGNGATQDITGIGFQPDTVWVKKTTGGTARQGVFRTSSQIGNAALPFLGAASLTDRITAIISNGISLGSGVETNENSFTYQYAAWKEQTPVVVSVTLSTDGTVSYGTLGSAESTHTISLGDTQTAVNDGNVPVDINIKTNSPAGWSLGNIAGEDIFVHEFSTNSGTDWTKFATADVYQTLVNNVWVDASQNFDLRLTAPNPSTTSTEKTITVTIQAVEAQ